MFHIPVLLTETIGMLSPQKGDRILDCTFGGGGHTKALLEAADCYVYGLDCDPDSTKRAESIKGKYPDRFDFTLCKFSQASEILKERDKFDAVLFDFGMSSFQVDDASRGFSFSKEGRLDMRMSLEGLSAYDAANSFSEEDIAAIIHSYGNESISRAKKIASAIAEARKLKAIETTTELREIVRKAVGFSAVHKKYSKIDAATKTFQAFRIFVNDELTEIDSALTKLSRILNDNAKIATISFHALEDGIVKNWARARKDCISPINKSVIKASKEEILENPRSRSAILRGFVYNKKEEDYSFKDGGKAAS
ncbi:MAG: 16S rRNA (cytosine(1402)-N(4))-methyltransferase RsmH [Holosporales bacterium]|jgi:16S rRNA (cytosine1402-N4)-methyltransferase|nr:16S rRNA (cytosine(1402)-N(4))-methyltransferase RsmH [Holosporales bacterium]